jgi:hypothetical protein
VTVTAERRLGTRWLVLAVLCLAQLTVVLDSSWRPAPAWASAVPCW